MPALRVYLFQTLNALTPEERPLDLGSPTARSLFACLILNRSHPLDRRRLAFLFWPRASESAARRNLRQYLHRLRRALEPVDPGGSWLDADGHRVQLTPAEPVWVDVDSFRLLARPESGLGELQQAAGLYRGDLLEDVYEDWCQTERQALRRLYLDALDRLSQSLPRAGRLDEALHYAQAWTAAEPLDEAAHRRLMLLYALNGERHRAVQHYRQLSLQLTSELDASPLPETSALFEQIQAGGLLPEINGAPLVERAPHAAVGGMPGKQAKKPTPMVGRQVEMLVLERLQLRAAAGQGGFVLVNGESGIGKTRLVQEYLSRCPTLPVLQSACLELEAVQPFAALRSVLSQAASLLPPAQEGAVPAWSEPLARLVGSPGRAGLAPAAWQAAVQQPHDEALSVAEAAGRLVLDLLASLPQQPLHLVLDDLQWADTPSWNALVGLAQLAASQPLLLIGMCRLEDLPPERGRLLRTLERNHLLQSLPLERLTPEDSAVLARNLLPKANPDSFFLHRLYQETEGNPFFIIEIVSALQDSGQPGSWSLERSSRPAAGLPLSIQRVIEARLDLLSPNSQELLSAAAAIGGAFSFALLQAISQAEESEVIAALEAGVLRGLVREDASGYVFSHDKLRQVAYLALSRARRQVIHRRIAEVLETAVPAAAPANLAYHYARSDQPLKALPYLTRAGEQALQARSYQEARQIGLQAVSLLGRLPGPQPRGERVDLNLQLAQAYAFTGDLRRAREILAETEHLAIAIGDEVRLGALFHRSAQIYWLRGQAELAGDYARRLLRSAEESGDAGLLRAALRMLGRVSIALSAFDDAIAYLLRYINLETVFSPPADLPIVLGYLGVAYARVGSWARALEAAQQGVALAQQAAHGAGGTVGGAAQALAFTRMQLAFVYADYHDWRSCLDLVQSAPDPLSAAAGTAADGFWQVGARETDQGLTPLGFMLLGLRGLALAHLGEPQAGVLTIRPALEWAGQSDYRVFHYLPRLFLAEALLLAHQPHEAQREAQAAVEEARLAGNRWAAGAGLRLLAESQARLPAPPWTAVEAHLIESMQILRQVRARPDLARTYLALRRLYDRAGQIAWAVDCHFRATSIFEELAMAEELRLAQGQAAHERRGAVVIPGLALKGPN